MVQIPRLCPGNMFITYLPAISVGQTSTTDSITTDDQNNQISLDNSNIPTDINGMTHKHKDSTGALPIVTQFVDKVRTVKASGCKNFQEINPQVISSKDLNSQKLRPPSPDVLFTSSNINERRKSKSEQENILTSQKSNNTKNILTDETGPHSTEANNLELSTLTSLYQESRRRIFGEEWAKRKTSAPVQRKEDVGCTGVSKPRKLSPLSVIPPGKNTIRRESITPPIKAFSKDSQLFSHLPTPGGLHLSANFSHMSFRDMECSLNSSKGSRRSFRRNNSMSEISVLNLDEGAFNPQTLHRTSSAPDIHKKGKKEDGKSSTPPMVTPARANTPTEPAKVIRPQLIGGSLATCSPDQTVSVPQNSNKSNLEREIAISKQLNTPIEFPPLIASRTLHTSPPDIAPSTEMRPMRRSLPARLSISSHGKVASDTFHSFLSTEQRLPPKSSRQRLTPLNNPIKKYSLP